jgi:YihY family inner membrane protein
VRDLFPVRVARRFLEHDGGSQAILIAWQVLTAVFPVALGLAAIGGLVVRAAAISPDTIARQVVAIFPADVGAQDAALRGIEGLRQQTAIFGVLAVLGFVWTGTNLFGSMERVFGVVFGTGPRRFVPQKLMSLAMMGLFTVLALVAAGTSALLPVLNHVPGMPVSLTRGAAGLVVQVVVGVVSGFVLFFVIYFVVPNRRQHPRSVWAGALFSGVALELLSQVFPLYIRLDPGLNRYGRNFALLFILLTFTYLLGVITIVGADVIALADPPRRDRSEVPVEAGRARMGRVRHLAYGAAGLLIGLALTGRRRP